MTEKKKISIALDGEGGFAKVEAFCIPGGVWAVHKTPTNNKKWSLTHLPTKSAAGNAHNTKEDAVEFSTILDAVPGNPWASKNLTDACLIEGAKLMKQFTERKKEEMTTLFEKLQARKNAPIEEPVDASVAEDVPLAEDASVAEDVPLAEDVDTPEDTPAAEENIPSIVERIKAIGDQQAVNPPKPNKSQSCPHCGKVFRVLAKHKCLVVPEPKVSEEPSTVELAGKLKLSMAELEKKALLPNETVKVDKLPTPIKEKTKDTTEKSESYMLLIDCLLEKNFYPEVDQINFSNMILPICQQVAKDNSALNWNTIEYNPGPGLISALLENYLKVVKYTGVLIVDSMTPEYRACATVLKAYASTIIQGVK